MSVQDRREQLVLRNHDAAGFDVPVRKIRIYEIAVITGHIAAGCLASLGDPRGAMVRAVLATRPADAVCRRNHSC